VDEAIEDGIRDRRVAQIIASLILPVNLFDL
jgi:hypothetical protein